MLNHQEDQHHEQHVDQRDDDDGRCPLPLVSDESHTSVRFGRRAGANGRGRGFAIRRSRLGAVMLAEEFVADGFHADGKTFHLAAVVTPGHQRRNGDDEAHERGVERDADAVGELGAVGGRPAVHGGEQ